MIRSRHELSALSIYSLVPPVACSSVIVTMKAADLIGRSSFVAVVLSSVILAVGVAAVAFRRSDSTESHPLRLSLGDGLVLVAVAGALIGVWSRGLQRTLTSPVVYGVDPARHVSMTAWIVEHQRLVQGVEPQLGGLSNYPPGGHVLAAMLSWSTGATPLAATWIVVVASVAVAMLLVAVLAGEVAPRCNAVPGLVAGCLYLVAWRFTIGMATYEFFFSQAVGIALSLGGVLVVVVGLKSRVSWWRWVPAAAVTAIASFVTYPQQALVVPAGLAVGMWYYWRRDRVGFSVRAVGVAVGVLLLAGAAGVVILRRSGYLNGGALFGVGEGAVTTLSVGRVGGWVPFVLVAWGMVTCVRLIMERVPEASVVLVALLVPVGLASGLWLLQHGVLFRAPVTQYRIAKNVFTAVPLAAVVAGIGVGSMLRPAMWRSRVVALGAAFVMVIVPWQPRMMGTTRQPIVSADGYALARWAASRYNTTDIGLAGPELEPFTLWIAGLRRPLDTDAVMEELVPRAKRWADWPIGDTKEKYLLVSGNRLVRRYAHRSGVKMVRRQGDAALFKRA